MLRLGRRHLWSDVSFHDSFSSRSSNWRWKWLRHGCLMVSEAREGHCEASTPSTRTLGPHLRPVHLAASDRQRRNNQESCRQLLDSHRTNQPTNQPPPSQKKKKKRTDIGVFSHHQLVKFSFEWTEVSTFPVLSVKEACPSETICEAHWQRESKGNPPQPTHNGESWSDGWDGRHKNMLLQKYFDLDTGRQLFHF